MFDILAQTTISINTLSTSINLSLEDVRVEVWTKTDTYIGFESQPKQWSKIVDTRVRGMGKDEPTLIPSEDFSERDGPIILDIGSMRSFYVTLRTPNLWYKTLNKDSEEIFASDPNVLVYRGSGVDNYPFGRTVSPRGWIGQLFYDVIPHRTFTTLDAGSGSYGAMIDIVAKTNVVVMSMSFLTRVKVNRDTTVSVYTKAGSFVGFEDLDDKWVTVCENLVLKSKGPKEITAIPSEEFENVRIYMGETQAFYITLDSSNLLCTETSGKVGSLFNSNSQMEILVGSGILDDHFGRSIPSRVFNGAFHFNFFQTETPSQAPTLTHTSKPSSSPTVAPTGRPTTRPTISLSPTSKPTHQPQAPTSTPSLAPTGSPSSAPSSNPTATPTIAPTTTAHRTFNVAATLRTTLVGGNGSYGSMFDLVTKSNEIVVRSIEFHTDIIDERTLVEVYTRSGSFQGFERDPSAWRKIASETLLGQGPLLGTLISSGFDPVTIKAGRTQAFYVTLPTHNLRYTNALLSTGSVFSADSNIKCLVGVGVGGYPFGETYQDRIFNGNIHYSTLEAAPTPAPIPITKAPTNAPTIFEEGIKEVVTQKKFQMLGVPSYVQGDINSVAYFEYIATEFLNAALGILDAPVNIKSVVVGWDPDVTYLPQKEDGHSRFLQDPGGNAFAVEGSDVAQAEVLDFYVTITGEYEPPPFLNFASVVEDAFDDKGEVFIEELKKEETFQEIEAMEVIDVSFAVPTASPTVYEEEVLNNIVAKHSTGLIALYSVSGVMAFMIFLLLVFRRYSKEMSQQRSNEFENKYWERLRGKDETDNLQLPSTSTRDLNQGMSTRDLNQGMSIRDLNRGMSIRDVNSRMSTRDVNNSNSVRDLRGTMNHHGRNCMSVNNMNTASNCNSMRDLNNNVRGDAGDTSRRMGLRQKPMSSWSLGRMQVAPPIIEEQEFEEATAPVGSWRAMSETYNNMKSDSTTYSHGRTVSSTNSG
eukprot:CAMPEP_0195539364 /NCGR_PEP_ID=MMETSP0794_2-20130614/50012_1 /TAXON_ID=515487 /ORGANISM="Stephanopyxis turris, Strain CCMP 815" /LENGTH=977 /DNA_ID=CAMNT_0040673389 /DNA_START=295 /DNA_END=3228 /DNA_ORIENTATION=-